MIGIIFLVAFFALMTGVGIWGMRKTKTLNDFFLGGRSLGPWISAAAYGTTYFSAVIFIGFAGKQGYQFGLNALWIALGNALIGAGLAWPYLKRSWPSSCSLCCPRPCPPSRPSYSCPHPRSP